MYVSPFILISFCATFCLILMFIITDTDECRDNNGTCSKLCTVDDLECECPPGYIFQPNTDDCKGE